MILIDTNIILRYLLNDDKKLNKKASEIIDINDVFITNEVIFEVCYVLHKIYKIDKVVIYSLILELCAMDTIHFNNYK